MNLRRGRVKPRKRRRNHVRRLPKRMFRNPGDLVALDTVEIRPGARLFCSLAVDHHSRLAFAMAFPKRNAQCAAEFLRRLLLVLPVPVLALLSDNLNCAGPFGAAALLHLPLLNERFNRTLRYGFVQANEHLHAFNRQSPPGSITMPKNPTAPLPETPP